MRVGVAIPARNALRYIEQQLTSILAQTYPLVAAYVYDDASDDGMDQFLRDRPTWCRHMARGERRLGWPGAVNAAAQLAIDDGCDAVFVAAADDWMRNDCIEKCVRTLMRHDWVVPFSQQVGAENVVQVSQLNIVLEDFATWPPLTDKALFRREVWQAVGGYSSDIALPGSYGCKEDWEFWIKVWKAGFTDYGVITEPVYFYRMHPGQLHRDDLDRTDQAVARIRAKHPDVWERAAARAAALAQATVPQP